MPGGDVAWPRFVHTSLIIALCPMSSPLFLLGALPAAGALLRVTLRRADLLSVGGAWERHLTWRLVQVEVLLLTGEKRRRGGQSLSSRIVLINGLYKIDFAGSVVQIYGARKEENAVSSGAVPVTVSAALLERPGSWKCRPKAKNGTELPPSLNPYGHRATLVNDRHRHFRHRLILI